MKAVMLEVPDYLLEERRRQGLDRGDEVWEGVIHMVPPPTWEHQNIVQSLAALFIVYFRAHGLGQIALGLGVRDPHSPTQNYRVPEWVAVRKEHEHLLSSNSSFVDQGPDMVVEVRSPGDETDEKKPFYEKVRCGELLIVHRDTRHVQLLRLSGTRHVEVPASADGWIRSEALQASFRTIAAEGRARLCVRLDLDGTEHLV